SRRRAGGDRGREIAGFPHTLQHRSLAQSAPFFYMDAHMFTLGYYFFAAALACLPFIIAVIAPTWRWLLNTFLFVLAFSFIVCALAWLLGSPPKPGSDIGSSLGILVGGFLVFAFLWGIAARAMTLSLGWKDNPTFIFHAVAFVLLLA